MNKIEERVIEKLSAKEKEIVKESKSFMKELIEL